MKKGMLNRILSARLAIRKEDAELLASSDFKPLFDDNGNYEGVWKADGEPNQVNNITYREDGIAVIHVDGALSFRSDFLRLGLAGILTIASKLLLKNALKTIL